jgi:hypothetical protein
VLFFASKKRKGGEMKNEKRENEQSLSDCMQLKAAHLNLQSKFVALPSAKWAEI